MDVTFSEPQTLITNRPTAMGSMRVQEFGKLAREGMMIELHVTGASIFVTSMEWAEVGVNNESIKTEWMSKGRKHVYPPEMVDRLKSCISKFRQMYKDHVREIPGLPMPYLHFKRHQSFMDNWQRLSLELADIREDLIAAREQAMDEVAAQYTIIAQESWRQATANGESSVIFNREEFTDVDLFVDALVARAVAKVPDEIKIEEKVEAYYTTFAIQSTESLLREEARAARALAEAQAEADRLRQETDHQARMNALEEETKQAAIQAMWATQADRLREELNAGTSPLEETFVALRQDIAQAANEIVGKIDKAGGKLHGRSAKRALETLSELFEARSIVDDQKLCQKLAELREKIGPVGQERAEDAPERNVADVKAKLEELRDMVRTAREDYMQEPSRFAMLD